MWPSGSRGLRIQIELLMLMTVCYASWKTASYLSTPVYIVYVYQTEMYQMIFSITDYILSQHEPGGPLEISYRFPI